MASGTYQIIDLKDGSGDIEVMFFSSMLWFLSCQFGNGRAVVSLPSWVENRTITGVGNIETLISDEFLDWLKTQAEPTLLPKVRQAVINMVHEHNMIVAKQKIVDPSKHFTATIRFYMSRRDSVLLKLRFG